jgi:outer membrane immunogenic protein
MRKLLLGAAGLVAAMSVTAPASAADMGVPYTKAPVMTPAYYDWSGFNIGLNGGGGSARKCWDMVSNAGVPVVPAFREGCHDATGGLAGGQIGYRWQWASSWVFGIEAQGDWADLKGSNASAFPFVVATTNQSKVNSFGLFTGQVGYAWNNVLWYVKGGGAVVDDRYTGIVTATNIALDQVNDTRWGGTVGTGVEFSFAPNWSVAVEYDHLFMGSRTQNFTSTVAGAFTRSDSIKQDLDIGTVRVNYRWGGPVIAKY